MQASITARTGGDDQSPKRHGEVTAERRGSSASNEMGGPHGNRCDPLDALLTSGTDAFTSYFHDNTFDFSGPFPEPVMVNLSEIMDLDVLLPNAQEPLGGTSGNNISGLSPEQGRPRPSPPNSSRGRRAAECTLREEEDSARALSNIEKYPAHMLAPLRLPSKYAMQRFLKAFFEHISAHIPIVHEPTFDITTVPCKSHG